MVSALPDRRRVGRIARNGTAYTLTKPMRGDRQRGRRGAEPAEPAQGQGAQHADQPAEGRRRPPRSPVSSPTVDCSERGTSVSACLGGRPPRPCLWSVPAAGLLEGDGGVDGRLADDVGHAEGDEAGDQAGEQATDQEVRRNERISRARSVAGEAEQVPAVVDPLVHRGARRSATLRPPRRTRSTGRPATAARRRSATAAPGGRTSVGHGDGDAGMATAVAPWWCCDMCPPGFRRPVCRSTCGGWV